MGYQRILTIQDISCVGQCSMTVALPILSACGLETCILPSAVLSSHTGGFQDPHVRDLTADFPAVLAHWQREGIIFDAVYTGYLGSEQQIDYVQQLLEKNLRPEGKSIVDPVMGDHGRLYKGFTPHYVEAMKGLCRAADVILPNITEASMMTGLPYRETYDAAYVDSLLDGLRAMGAKDVVLTGVSYEAGQSGAVILQGKDKTYFSHRRVPGGYHGTGDIFASTFVGCWLQGQTMAEAAQIAAECTVAAIEATIGDKDHWYGVKFEKMLPLLVDKLAENK